MKPRHNPTVHGETSADANPFLPDRHSFKALKEAVQHCQGCPLFQQATQAVFGEGPTTARLLIIGEAPGDQEDLAGQPFVGPAGSLLDESLAACGLSRTDVFITNAVKHFKWTASGTRRLHAKPSAREIHACRPWLEAELELVHPQTVVCLGATAAQTLLGPKFRLTATHGQPQASSWAECVIATYHPAAVLRAPDPALRRQLHDFLFADMRTAALTLA